MMNNQWILVLFSSSDKFADVWPFGIIVETQLDARNCQKPAELWGINDIVAALTPVFDP